MGEFGPMLLEIDAKGPAQIQLARLPEEVFADVVSSLYLGSIGLVKPAHTTIRRALELGLALVYLWDMPHAFWGWKECDKDLAFSEMLEHLESRSYKSFLANEIGLHDDSILVNGKRLRDIYRITSNTAHGKISTHKVLMGDRFSHVPAEWLECLDLLDGVTSEVVRLWLNRYPGVARKVREVVPAYDRIYGV